MNTTTPIKPHRQRRVRHDSSESRPGLLRRLVDTPHRLHQDEGGSISILSVFTIIILAMILGMVLNVGREVDSKMRMQNAADAVSFSGGILMARNMNTLAFTNKLLCDVFAQTAFLREARDNRSDSAPTPGHPEQAIEAPLNAWLKVAQVFKDYSSKWNHFRNWVDLGPAIEDKVPTEREMVRAFCDWHQARSESTLPVLEEILTDELISKYQRALTLATPQLVQLASAEIARRHGLDLDGEVNEDRGPMMGLMWRTNAVQIGHEDDVYARTLPVIDPKNDVVPGLTDYQNLARGQRNSYAIGFLNDWNDEYLDKFDANYPGIDEDDFGKMSQFERVWRGFTFGQLNKLNEENENKNFPFMIRRPVGYDATKYLDPGYEVNSYPDATSRNNFLEKDYMFVGVAYWKEVTTLMDTVFDSPVENDRSTYAQVMLFIPRRRLHYYPHVHPSTEFRSLSQDDDFVQCYGAGVQLPYSGKPRTLEAYFKQWGLLPCWLVGHAGTSTRWDLWNQSWIAKMVPAQTVPVGNSQLLNILQTAPIFDYAPEAEEELIPPNVGQLSPEDLPYLNNH